MMACAVMVILVVGVLPADGGAQANEAKPGEANDDEDVGENGVGEDCREFAQERTGKEPAWGWRTIHVGTDPQLAGEGGGAVHVVVACHNSKRCVWFGDE